MGIEYLIAGGNENCIGHIGLVLGIYEFPLGALPFDVGYVNSESGSNAVGEQLAAQIIGNLLGCLEIGEQESLVLYVLERSL